MNNNHVYIIGEIGVNHNGDIKLAKELIDVAKDAGVDAVKFQSFHPEKNKIRTAPYAQYQKNKTKDKSSFEMSMRLKLSRDDHIVLKEYCDKVDIDFLSTGFDRDSVDLLEELNVKYQKIPSGEINNFPLIEYVAGKNKPIILSTGMANIAEIAKCIEFIKKYNTQELIVLHCVSLYPTPFRLLNLKVMSTLREAFGVTVGLSDHTLGYEADVAAVALGAKILEKHITLDNNMEGPDHQASLNPVMLKEMVRAVRNIELALGDGVKIVSDEELEMRKVSRRSIVADKPIREGEVFSLENLTVKKPGTGISADFLNVIVGRKSTRDIGPDEILAWNMIGEIAEA